MKIHRQAGKFVIHTPEEFLRDQLRIIERMGRICYQSEKGPITDESAQKFINMIMKRGHESAIEHSIISVIFNNCSRGFTHELVRHRLCAFSQESTRYVDYAKEGEGVDLDKFQLNIILPPHWHGEGVVDVNGERLTPAEMFQKVEEYYRALRKAGWAPQDARQILPIGLKSQIGVSANFREWRHIFSMRTAKAAHWEIRTVMCDLLRWLKTQIPVIFNDFVEREKDAKGVPFFDKLDW